MSYKSRLIIFLVSLITTPSLFLIFPEINSPIELYQQKIKNSVFKLETPKIIKGIYLTNYSTASKNKIQGVIEFARKGLINSVVIDIKDWSGYIDYDIKIPQADIYQSRRILISDLSVLINKLHQEKIYTIARIVVFSDPVLAKARPDLAIHHNSMSSYLWLDRSGLAWVDPSSQEVWDYIIAIAKDALKNGFDEVNFDYIRFPSDGKLNNMIFPFWHKEIPKNIVIKKFFEYLRTNLPEAKLSVDLFGYTTVNNDDLGIGQIIEDAFPYFDYLCPMVYPSHYNPGFLGYLKPAQFPYEVVKKSMETAQKRLDLFNQSQPKPFQVKIRPWLQDFNLGAIYDIEMVKKQVQATQEGLGQNYRGYLLWNAKNIYHLE